MNSVLRIALGPFGACLRGSTTTMDQRSLAISILQQARDTLLARLASRIVDSRDEIEADAEGQSYLSEIETIYDQLGGRLAHLNAMLSNLPSETAHTAADATANEIVYADLAAGHPLPLDVDAALPPTVLALPAPSSCDEPRGQPLVESFASVVLCAQAGDLSGAARLISELLDIKPSQARRASAAFALQMERFPELALRFEQLGCTLEETNDYAAATLLGECFEFQAIDALSLVRGLKRRLSGIEAAD